MNWPDIRRFLIFFTLAAGALFGTARFLANPGALVAGFILSVEAAIVQPFNLVFEARRLSDELSIYQRNYAKALTEFSICRQVDKENAALRAQLNLGKRPLRTLMPGRLVYAEKGLAANRFLMRLERVAATSAGLPVVSQEDALIGKVSRGSGQYAWVTFITDAGSVLSARTSRSDIKGIVRGSIQGGLTMELAHSGELPVQGEAVVTDTLDPNVPPNLLIGTVDKVPTDPAGLINSVEVRPAVVLPADGPIFIIESW